MSGILQITADHLKRTVLATRGFALCGRKWLMPWLTYALSPALSRMQPKRRIAFEQFSARLGECDLYTYANVFEDYRVSLLERALEEVELVIDAGANVGAFSWLVLTVAQKNGANPHLIAVEPDASNVRFLSAQPFADRIEIVEGALGARDGHGRFVTGANSVTHTVDILADENGADDKSASLRVYGLGGLCAGKSSLLKMDIEGGEHEVLAVPLPPSVRYMFLEWHPKAGHADHPQSRIEGGRWHLLSQDLWGSSCWFWEADKI
ncbi:hypothetical protein AYO41_01625 [Verrucomicrobia bacterium SCGC AG-212-E04]|nr:hypothetical protein AYO41_01625 [Verrucomicrobia bacterium SCGC AG-212-E04]